MSRVLLTNRIDALFWNVFGNNCESKVFTVILSGFEDCETVAFKFSVEVKFS